MAHNSYRNPLLLDFVKEWWDTARERNSKGAIVYKKAYESLKACPIPFQHPSALVCLQGWGDGLCKKLTAQLEKHCKDNGLPMPKRAGAKKRASDALGLVDDDADESPQPPPKKIRKAKAYVPAYRSGAYAIVLALSKLDQDGRSGLTKGELIEEAQKHCDSSFTAPSDPTKFYTAWASMKTLTQKEFVYERGRPSKRYLLTDEGWEVAKRIRENAVARGDIPAEPAAPSTSREPSVSRTRPDLGPGRVLGPGPSAGQGPAAVSLPPPARSAASLVFLDDDDDDDYFDNDDDALFVDQRGAQGRRDEEQTTADDSDVREDESAIPTFTPIRLSPGSFTVELMLDVREVRAKTDRDYMQEELTKKGIKPIMKALEVGDCLWVAKCNDPEFLARQGIEGSELVLDWIVERKRLDDLIESLKDGRYHEQKFRLRRSGIQNVIYLIEEISIDPVRFGRHEEGVQTAIAQMQVVNGYFVKRTQKMDDTIRYLASMTRLLKKIYENKPLNIIPTKVLTDKNYLPLLQHLRQTQPNVSHHIAYPAFASLASKSDMMTLRDVYLKMLMCTRGVTGEKAIEIQKRWKTPYDLIKAYQRFGSDEAGKKAKINLIMNELSHLVGRKKFGKAVSQKVAEVWGDL
ncbi:ERCC4 domain-containing protein [Diplogelasinospora grovesii]|uniref:Crossover junction endonuclease MUS81 n=1 Tax=Diplogelasinospora grovesii TaxID=303347 RepID=A0AAN6N9X0_9PEZI|nr:ERCC4 domain-containing protein [Diplogelasinospora grovesii]